jgi:hypothetical protein
LTDPWIADEEDGDVELSPPHAAVTTARQMAGNDAERVNAAVIVAPDREPYGLTIFTVSV